MKPEVFDELPDALLFDSGLTARRGRYHRVRHGLCASTGRYHAEYALSRDPARARLVCQYNKISAGAVVTRWLFRTKMGHTSPIAPLRSEITEVP